MGATARCRGSLEPSPRAPGDGREPLACAPSRRAQPREDLYDGTIVTDKVNENVGNGHEPDRHHRGKGGPMFSSPSNTRTQKSSAFTPRVQPIASRRWSRSGRGVSVLRLHRARRGAMSSSCVTIMAPITCPAISRARIKCLGIEASPSFVREPRGQWRRRALHPNLEGELCSGCGRSKPSRNCAPSFVAFARRATMKLGSSRGMDTKRPQGSERSKPCHQLRLTRRSLPPYPWPPEQAQPGVSKPCRTTQFAVFAAVIPANA